MQTIVSCPACDKKLKVATTSVGKSVKCPCGNVFVAHAAASEPAPAPRKARPRAAVAEEDEEPRTLSDPPRPRVPGSPLLTTFTLLVALVYVGLLAATYFDYLDPYFPERQAPVGPPVFVPFHH